MNLVERVAKYKLPTRQRKVIEEILNDLESSTFLTGSEICEKFSISFPSLTRMAKSLQYSGFPELKKEIERMFKKEFSPATQAEEFLENTKDKSILNIVYTDEVDNLKRMRNSLSEKELLISAKIINKAKRVFIIGVGQALPLVQKHSESLKLLGKDVVCLTNIGFSKMLDIYKIGKGDVLISFSMNKELEELSVVLENIASKKIPSILYTDKKSGRLRNKVEFSFYAPSVGSGMINRLTPFIVLTNILESYIFSLDKHVHLNKIKKIESSWDSLPIFLN